MTDVLEPLRHGDGDKSGALREGRVAEPFYLFGQCHLGEPCMGESTLAYIYYGRRQVDVLKCRPEEGFIVNLLYSFGQCHALYVAAPERAATYSETSGRHGDALKSFRRHGIKHSSAGIIHGSAVRDEVAGAFLNGELRDTTTCSETCAESLERRRKPQTCERCAAEKGVVTYMGDTRRNVYRREQGTLAECKVAYVSDAGTHLHRTESGTTVEEDLGYAVNAFGKLDRR